MHTHVCTHTHTHAHIYAHRQTHIHTRIHTCMHTHARTHTHTHRHTHLNAHTRTHTHRHTYVHTHTHTYAHTHTQLSASSAQHYHSRLKSGLESNCYLPRPSASGLNHAVPWLFINAVFDVSVYGQRWLTFCMWFANKDVKSLCLCGLQPF